MSSVGVRDCSQSGCTLRIVHPLLACVIKIWSKCTTPDVTNPETSIACLSCGAVWPMRSSGTHGGDGEGDASASFNCARASLAMLLMILAAA